MKKTKKKSDTIGVGVIGAGRIGKLHAETVATRIPRTELVAIADLQVEAAENIARRHSHVAVSKDYHAVLDNDAVDAVVICSPTDTHAQITREAAHRGKHVFCEKPIDLSLDQIRGTIDEVKKAGVKFMVGFNRRFDPNFSRVRELIINGAVGVPHILRITSRDPGPPPASYIRVSGGLFLDMAIHDFDMARYLMGEEVKEVYASGAVLVDPVFKEEGDVDTAITSLVFESGAIGAIDNSRKAAYGYDQRVEVFGSAGMASVKNETPDTHLLADANGVHTALPLHFFMERYTESYYLEMRAFIDCVAHDTDPPVNGNDGLASVAIALAAKRSLSTHRPVRIDEIL